MVMVLYMSGREGGRKEVSKVGGVNKGARKGRKKEREESERAGRRKHWPIVLVCVCVCAREIDRYRETVR